MLSRRGETVRWWHSRRVLCCLAIFERFGVVPDVRYRPTTFELTRALVGRGMGYALLVQRPANERTYEGHRVVVTEIAEPVGDSRVLVVWPKTMRLNRRAQAFVEFCLSRRPTAPAHRQE